MPRPSGRRRDDHEDVADRIDEAEVLEERGHVRDGEDEPGEEHRGEEEEERRIIACCCVWQTVEMNRPMPSVLS
jgi:hypothetical protein